MKEKDYLDEFVDVLFPGNTKEEQEIRNSLTSLKNSVNAFIIGLADVIGDEKASEKLNKCKCECNKNYENEYKCTCDVDKKEAHTTADRLKEYYENADKKAQYKTLIDEIEKYVLNNMEPTELGGLLEKCGDVLKMQILDRAIVASFSALDPEYKSELTTHLLNETGFSGISFETVNKTDLYLLFRF